MNTLRFSLLPELAQNPRTHTQPFFYSVRGRVIVTALVHLLTVFSLLPTARSAELFVTNVLNGTIGEYDAKTGATIDGALISGLSSPIGLGLSGNKLFVVNRDTGTVGEYTTSGATVNASLISGLSIPLGLAVSGGKLLITDAGNGTIAEYTTSGALVNPSLVSGLSGPFGIAVSGGKIFVVNTDTGTIGVYDAATGATINSALASSLGSARDIAVHSGRLFISLDAAAGVAVIDAVTGLAVEPFGIPTSSNPRGIAFFGGNVLIASLGEDRINAFPLPAGPPNFGFILNQGLSGPEHIAIATPESGPGLFVFGAVLLAMHFVRRRIVATQKSSICAS